MDGIWLLGGTKMWIRWLVGVLLMVVPLLGMLLFALA
jgi:hypothetical protein